MVAVLSIPRIVVISTLYWEIRWIQVIIAVGSKRNKNVGEGLIQESRFMPKPASFFLDRMLILSSCIIMFRTWKSLLVSKAAPPSSLIIFLSLWEIRCQNTAFETFLSRLCGWEMTFAEYITPFILSMHRLRCQAKVEAKMVRSCHARLLRAWMSSTIKRLIITRLWSLFCIFNPNVLTPEMICIISLTWRRLHLSEHRSHARLLDTLSSLGIFSCFHTTISGAFPFIALK